MTELGGEKAKAKQHEEISPRKIGSPISFIPSASFVFDPSGEL